MVSATSDPGMDSRILFPQEQGQGRPMLSDAPRGSASLDDVQLMHRIQVGDTAAFAAFYDRDATAVHGFAHQIVHSNAIAEDVTQDAFLSLWRARCRYAGSRG